MKRPGVTLVELMVGLAISSLVMMILYQAFNLLFSGRGRHSLTSMTKRSFIQKDVKAGYRRLFYRLRESIQVLDPPPGHSSSTLTVMDITNKQVRMRLDTATSELVSERFEGGAWVRESRPTTVQVGGQTMSATIPVSMHNCTSVEFTTLSPECVSVRAGLVQEGQAGSFMMVIKLRNSGLAY